VWGNINRGRFCKAMYRSSKIPRTSTYYNLIEPRYMYNRKTRQFEDFPGLDQHPNDVAFNEALVTQLSLTLNLIPESEPCKPKTTIDQEINALLKGVIVKTV